MNLEAEQFKALQGFICKMDPSLSPTTPGELCIDPGCNRSRISLFEPYCKEHSKDINEGLRELENKRESKLWDVEESDLSEEAYDSLEDLL